MKKYHAPSRTMEGFVFLPDNQPTIQALGQSAVFESQPDTLFDESVIFQATTNLTDIRTLEAHTKKGWNYVQELYAHRSLANALPQPADAAQVKFQIELIQPKITMLNSFMEFITQISSHFIKFIKDNDPKIEGRYTDSHLDQLVHFLDLFLVLDKIRASKPYFGLDLQAYLGNVLRLGSDVRAQDNLAAFLASSLLEKFRKSLMQHENAQPWLTLLTNFAVDGLLEAEQFLLPHERFVYLRVVTSVVYLLDTPAEDLKAIQKIKDLQLTKVSKLIKTWPVLPIYGDLFISSADMLKNLPSLSATPEFYLPDTKVAKPAHEVITTISKDRLKFQTTIASYQDLVNSIQLQPDSVQFAPEAYKQTLDCFRFLSDLSGKVLLQTFYKYANPLQGALDAPSAQNVAKETKVKPEDEAIFRAEIKKDDVKKVTDDNSYGRAVKFNYTEREFFTTTEYISMIKDLTNLLLKYKSVIHPLVQTTIHDRLQEFMHVDVRDVLRKIVAKTKGGKKKVPFHEEFLLLYSMGIDNPVPDDPMLLGKKDTATRTIPKRAVAPSPTQIEQLRALMLLLIKREKKSRLMSDHGDMDSKQEKHLKSLYSRSFLWRYLLDFENTLVEASDLSYLWFREIHLVAEKKIQFPIDLSFPWLLIENVLAERENVGSDIVSYVFYPFSIYNDVANRLLFRAKNQYLFDEVEAEANLAFERLLLGLRDKIYSHYKSLASYMMLDKGIKEEIGEKIFRGNMAKLSFLNTKATRFNLLFKQTHLELLGRRIDLYLSITQRLNSTIVDNINYAIQRFQASPLSGVIGFQSLLNVIRVTHHLLKKDLPHLDSFDKLFRVANESSSMTSFQSFLSLHIIDEVKGDLSTNYVYNSITQRFVPSAPSQAANPFPRPNFPRINRFLYGKKALTNIHLETQRLASGFVGIEHVRAIVQLLGPEAIPQLIEHLLYYLNKRLFKLIEYYGKEIYNLVPAQKWMRVNTYGTDGVFTAMDLAFKSFNVIDDIWFLQKGGFVQAFRHFGNFLIFFKLLDQAVGFRNQEIIIQSSSFLGVKPSSNPPSFTVPPTSPIAQTPKLDSQKKESRSTTASCYAPKPQASIFSSVLGYLDESVQLFKPYFTASPSAFAQGLCDHSELPVYQTHEFYRIWSALHYAFCHRPFSHANFGDGFLWAGCTLVHLFGQKERFQALDVALQMERLLLTRGSPHAGAHQIFQETVKNVREVSTVIFNNLQLNYPVFPGVPKNYPPDTVAGPALLTHRQNATLIKSSEDASSQSHQDPPAPTVAPPILPPSSVPPSLPPSLPPSGSAPVIPPPSELPPPLPPQSQPPSDTPPSRRLPNTLQPQPVTTAPVAPTRSASTTVSEEVAPKAPPRKAHPPATNQPTAPPRAGSNAEQKNKNPFAGK